MICPICHEEIKEESKFCGKCGNKIPRCPVCGKTIYKKARFCVYDGTMLPGEILKLLPEESELLEKNSKTKKERKTGRRIFKIILAIVILAVLIGAGIWGYVSMRGWPAFISDYLGMDEDDIEYTEDQEESSLETNEHNKSVFDENSEEKETNIVNQMIHISGENPSETSIMTANLLKESWGIEKFDAMVVVDEKGTSASFNAGYLAKENKAPILLIDQDTPDDVITYIKQNMKDKGTLYVLGSVNSMIQELEEEIPNANKIVLSGKDRYETNAFVLQQTNISNKEILVCCDADYRIGLAVSATGNPVLLVGATLTNEQKDLLSENSCEIICVGSDDDFSLEIIEELKKYDEEIEYIRGKEGYEIAINIANRFFDLPNSFVLAYDAYEDDYASSLCGVALAIENKAPFLISDDDNIQCVVDYVSENSIKTGYILEKTDAKNIDGLFQ